MVNTLLTQVLVTKTQTRCDIIDRGRFKENVPSFLEKKRSNNDEKTQKQFSAKPFEAPTPRKRTKEKVSGLDRADQCDDVLSVQLA